MIFNSLIKKLKNINKRYLRFKEISMIKSKRFRRNFKKENKNAII